MSRSVSLPKTAYLQRKGGVWRELVELGGIGDFARLFVRDEEAAGSNPASPTTLNRWGKRFKATGGK
jgi:hypothetical protein